MRLAVKGDWGYGSPEQAAVTRAMCRERRRRPFDTVITTGDNFYPTGTASPETFDRPEACLIRAGVRWRPAWGNHDLGGDSTAAVLGEPRRWYTFTKGPARVVVLDGNDPESPEQLTFLERTLTAAREQALVVVVHQPLYTAGPHPGSEAAQRLWAPLFRRHRVSLVLQGHNHAYERLRVAGIVYLTTGGGGAPLYPCVRRAAELERCRLAFNFLALGITSRRIVVRAIDPRGRVIDRVRIALAPRAPG